MHCHREPGSDQKAPEVKRIPRVCVGPCRSQTLVLRDVPGSPPTDDHPSQSDCASDRQRKRCRTGENEIRDAEYEAEWESETLGDLGIRQSASSLSSCRAMTRR